MADIFLSYSRDDRAAIEPLVEQILAAGYTVWWDKQLKGGKRYLEETEAELNAAKVVLVARSKTSIASHWVADEAGPGRDTGRLLPISLDGSMPPLGFRQFQTICAHVAVSETRTARSIKRSSAASASILEVRLSYARLFGAAPNSPDVGLGQG